MYDEDPPDNPFKSFTIEHKIYSNICKAINFYQTHEPGEYIDEALIFGNWKLPRRFDRKL